MAVRALCGGETHCSTGSATVAVVRAERRARMLVGFILIYAWISKIRKQDCIESWLEGMTKKFEEGN